MNQNGDRASRSLVTEMDFTVRMYDIDYNGHVSNIVYIRWLEDMRMVGFEKIASIEACLEAGHIPVLMNTNIDYIRPIKMFEKAKGILWVSKFTRATFTIEAEISAQSQLCAKAVQTIVFINRATNKAMRLPPVVISRLESLVAAKN